jgi:hypothetical protein
MRVCRWVATNMGTFWRTWDDRGGAKALAMQCLNAEPKLDVCCCEGGGVSIVLRPCVCKL